MATDTRPITFYVSPDSRLKSLHFFKGDEEISLGVAQDGLHNLQTKAERDESITVTTGEIEYQGQRYQADDNFVIRQGADVIFTCHGISSYECRYSNSLEA
jgi:hypothetical protein